ncbi:hypothetical protein PANT111_520051 [Pantoea brenneri]|uniref:Uncharacterized protein n=1 Tax=Pantoea brenneri TaxID=472694 RepID=A0AAX3JBS1_9GAMM|nr:hypothetical protein PANT111_520051 [Pantoea brenneri]
MVYSLQWLVIRSQSSDTMASGRIGIS